MRLFLFQIVFHELAVAAGILLILVIRDDASGFPCCFHHICRISTVLFPGFLPVCGIRVSRVLEYGRIHPSVFFCAQAQGAVLILYGLLLQHAQKQLVAAGFIISASAQFFQGDSILQDGSNLFGGFFTAVMVDDTVAVICLRVVFQLLRQSLLTCRRFFYKVCHAGIQQFQAAHPLYVGCHHQAVHPFERKVKLHHLGHLSGKGHDCVMEQVDPGFFFIGAAPLTETSQCPVAHRLLQKRGCVKGILKTDVEHQGLQQLIIGQSLEFLNDQGSDLDVYRCVWPGVFPTVKDGIGSFVYLWKDMLRKVFCPGLFKKLLFSVSQDIIGVKE